LRKTLDALYAVSGALAGVFLVLICVLVLAQIGARLLGTIVPSADDFARLCMAASSFLALAYTLRSGGHIRVTLLLDALPRSARHAAEIGCLGAAALLTGFFAYYTLDMTWESYLFKEYTIGLIPIPKWVPQAAMSLGCVLMFIAFVEDLIAVLGRRKPSYDALVERHDLSEG
jgi:TRAP-type C4-dicarboxylate transport system permease small subunit